jgi:LysM domain
MGAPSSIETPVAAAGARGAARSDVSGRQRTLRVVDASTPAFAVPATYGSVAAGQPRSSSIPILTGTVVSDRGRRFGSAASAQASPAPVRLTRRGRIVVTVLLVSVFTVAALLVTALVSGRAQATNHGEPRAGYQGMHEIVVRPGQTLWSIAAAANSTADPRTVVQEIMAANALGSPSITAGQLLWVP